FNDCFRFFPGWCETNRALSFAIRKMCRGVFLQCTVTDCHGKSVTDEHQHAVEIATCPLAELRDQPPLHFARLQVANRLSTRCHPGRLYFVDDPALADQCGLSAAQRWPVMIFQPIHE